MEFLSEFPCSCISLSPLCTTVHHSCLFQRFLESLLLWAREGQVCVLVTEIL